MTKGEQKNLLQERTAVQRFEYSPELEVIKGGKRRSEMGMRELRALFLAQSDMNVVVSDDSEAPAWIHIDLFGEVAKIPSIKNSKQIGMRRDGGIFISRDKRTRALLKTLDELWKLKAPRRIYYGEKELSGVLILSRKSKRSDPDNCASTVKDWLEPSDKKVGRSAKSARGWGGGLVDDDKTVSLFPLHSYQAGIPQDHTSIILTEFSRVREMVFNLIAGHYG